MNSSKRRYEKRHKVTRVFLADYFLLKELSNEFNISMAEALHKLITGPDHKEPVHPAQTRLPIELIALSTPVVTIAKSTPVTRARSTPITVSFSREVEHTNGHKRTD